MHLSGIEQGFRVDCNPLSLSGERKSCTSSFSIFIITLRAAVKMWLLGQQHTTGECSSLGWLEAASTGRIKACGEGLLRSCYWPRYMQLLSLFQDDYFGSVSHLEVQPSFGPCFSFVSALKVDGAHLLHTDGLPFASTLLPWSSLCKFLLFHLCIRSQFFFDLQVIMFTTLSLFVAQ